MAPIDTFGWLNLSADATISPMKQVRKTIGFTISAAGLVVLAAGLI